MPRNPENTRKRSQTAEELRRTQKMLSAMATKLQVALKTMEDAGIESIEVDGVTMLETNLGRVHSYVSNCEREIYFRA